MKQVYVKTPGYLIHLHGYGSVRTPVRFNVKDTHIKYIERHLQTQGIQYEVGNYDESVMTISDKHPHGDKLKIKEKKDSVEREIDMKELSKIIRRIVADALSSDPTIKNINDNIEKLIKQHRLSAPMEFDDEVKTEKRKREKRKVEKEEEFIPSIKIDEMTIQSKGVFRVEQADTDANKAAELLNQVTK